MGRLNLVGSEVENPQKNFPRALVGGVGFVAVVYLLFSAACLKVLPFDSVAASRHIASDVVEHIAGPTAAAWITLAMAISALGSMNSSVLSGARVGYAMARDGIFFKIADGIHPNFRTPGRSLIFQGRAGKFDALTGTFEELTNLFIFAAWIFYAFAVVALFRMRKTEPDLPAPLSLLGLSLGSRHLRRWGSGPHGKHLARAPRPLFHRPAANSGGTSFLSLVEHVRFSSQ